MVQSLRVFVIIGVMALAASGCQKGTKSGAKGDSGAGKGAESSAKGGGRSGDAGSGPKERQAPATAGGTRSTLTMTDDGTSVTLRLGQVLTVVLPSNRSAGLSWSMAEPPATVIVPEGKPTYKAGAGGASGMESWRFRAARRGQQTVRLQYQRGWQQSVPERTFRFAVTVR